MAVDCDFAVSATSQKGETTTIAIRDPECIKSGRFGLKSYNTGAQWRNVETRPATQHDLRSMIGDIQPRLAVPNYSHPEWSRLRMTDSWNPLSATFRHTVLEWMRRQSAASGFYPRMCRAPLQSRVSLRSPRRCSTYRTRQEELRFPAVIHMPVADRGQH